MGLGRVSLLYMPNRNVKRIMVDLIAIHGNVPELSLVALLPSSLNNVIVKCNFLS